jgi:hypothetical protein
LEKQNRKQKKMPKRRNRRVKQEEKGQYHEALVKLIRAAVRIPTPHQVHGSTQVKRPPDDESCPGSPLLSRSYSANITATVLFQDFFALQRVFRIPLFRNTPTQAAYFMHFFLIRRLGSWSIRFTGQHPSTHASHHGRCYQTAKSWSGKREEPEESSILE